MQPLLQSIKRNAFILGLLGVVLLAFAAPGLGAPEGPLRADLLSKAGVMVIFFLQGLSLKTRELVHGLRGARLHAFVQIWIFILAALVLAGAGLLLRALGLEEMGAGFFYLALIPTTISSAVAFTSAAGGNVAAAIFNTTLSNVIGVFWVPLGCVLIFSVGGGFDPALIGPLLLKLARLILLPLVAGQLLRPFVITRAGFAKALPHFKTVNHAIILFIVFATFCKSVLDDTWATVPALSIGLLLLLTGIAVLVVHLLVWISGNWILSDPGDRLTALFCGSQRTLAAGAPMAVAIFSGNGALNGASLGLILLPLLCYHPMQLFLAAFLLPRLQRP